MRISYLAGRFLPFTSNEDKYETLALSCETDVAVIPGNVDMQGLLYLLDNMSAEICFIPGVHYLSGRRTLEAPFRILLALEETSRFHVGFGSPITKSMHTINGMNLAFSPFLDVCTDKNTLAGVFNNVDYIVNEPRNFIGGLYATPDHLFTVFSPCDCDSAYVTSNVDRLSDLAWKEVDVVTYSAE